MREHAEMSISSPSELLLKNKGFVQLSATVAKCNAWLMQDKLELAPRKLNSMLTMSVPKLIYNSGGYMKIMLKNYCFPKTTDTYLYPLGRNLKDAFLKKSPFSSEISS